MLWLRTLTAFSALGFMLSACGGAAVQPKAKSPEPEKRSDLSEDKKKPERRQLVAPPPAYGNKVVRASTRVSSQG